MFLAEACLKAGKIGQAGDFLPDVLRGHAGKQVNAVTRDELQWLDKEVRNAVRRFDWTGSGRENPEGMELARLFALVEEGILSAFYKAENLNEEKIGELPARHRFGWHAARGAYGTGGAGEDDFVLVSQRRAGGGGVKGDIGLQAGGAVYRGRVRGCVREVRQKQKKNSKKNGKFGKEDSL